MAWIEIGVWWSPPRDQGLPATEPTYGAVLMHPFVHRHPDGTYDVGWQPMEQDLFPTPF